MGILNTGITVILVVVETGEAAASVWQTGEDFKNIGVVIDTTTIQYNTIIHKYVST